jgi:hypothetical protein
MFGLTLLARGVDATEGSGRRGCSITIIISLNHHPGALRHPSWPGGAIRSELQLLYERDSQGRS